MFTPHNRNRWLPVKKWSPRTVLNPDFPAGAFSMELASTSPGTDGSNGMLQAGEVPESNFNSDCADAKKGGQIIMQQSAAMPRGMQCMRIILSDVKNLRNFFRSISGFPIRIMQPGISFRRAVPCGRAWRVLRLYSTTSDPPGRRPKAVARKMVASPRETS